MFLKFFNGNLKNGPPDAVIYIFSIFLDCNLLLKSDHIEKCSESIGMNIVLYFLIFFNYIPTTNN